MIRVTIPEGKQARAYALGELGSPALTAALSASLQAQLAPGTTLSGREREGVRARMAHVIDCVNCLQWRPAEQVPDYSSEPIPEDFYTNIGEPSGWSGYSDRERLAIDFADRFGTDHESLQADDAFWERLHDHFTDAELADLALLSGTWLGSSRVMLVLGVKDA
jgi:alkylhydroperoxidase family enzyme